MAIVNSLAVGKAVNSAGNLTYQTVKGRTIAREKPVTVANPRTPAQVAQRNKMTNLVEAWRTFFFKARPYFTVIPGYGSPYNQFVKMNMPYANNSWFSDTDPNPLPIDSYVSNGKYGTTAISVAAGGATTRVVTVLDAQLKEEIQEGDQFITFWSDPALPHTLGQIIKTLTAAEVATIKTSGTISLSFGVIDASFAVVYYSPSRNVSSTARWKAV